MSNPDTVQIAYTLVSYDDLARLLHLREGARVCAVGQTPDDMALGTVRVYLARDVGQKCYNSQPVLQVTPCLDNTFFDGTGYEL